MAAGVGRIPEDRHASLVLDLPVSLNLILEHIEDFTRGGAWTAPWWSSTPASSSSSTRSRPPRATAWPRCPAATSRRCCWRGCSPASRRCIIVSQPTRGLDVGATEYVREVLLARRREGAAILLFSEDLEELLSLSDRLVVLYEGRIVGGMPAAEADPERLGMLMAGRGQVAA